jgi:hypothetical protein
MVAVFPHVLFVRVNFRCLSVYEGGLPSESYRWTYAYMCVRVCGCIPIFDNYRLYPLYNNVGFLRNAMTAFESICLVKVKVKLSLCFN